MDYLYLTENNINGNVFKNLVKLKRGLYTHTQIEKRNGLVFMRMKKRRVADLSS
jgi:hypothetical protein